MKCYFIKSIIIVSTIFNYQSVLNLSIKNRLNSISNQKKDFYGTFFNPFLYYNNLLLNETHHLLVNNSVSLLFKNSTHNSTHKSKMVFNKNNTARFKCRSDDIYCLCKYHPNYEDCVCLAYPKSIICSETFCNENHDTYECNPSFCDSNKNFRSKGCFCKRNLNHLSCKCKLNPFHKECFCMHYPMSHLCNERLCEVNINSLFCECNKNPNNTICAPNYCANNSNKTLCKCLISPLKGKCKCINDPSSCDLKIFQESIIEYEKKILEGNYKIYIENNTLINNLNNITNDIKMLYISHNNTNISNKTSTCLHLPDLNSTNIMKNNSLELLCSNSSSNTISNKFIEESINDNGDNLLKTSPKNVNRNNKNNENYNLLEILKGAKQIKEKIDRIENILELKSDFELLN